MNLACQKWLGNFTKVLGIGVTPPPPFWEKFPKNTVFFLEDPPNLFWCYLDFLNSIQTKQILRRQAMLSTFSCSTLILAYKWFVHCWEHGGPDFKRFLVLFFVTMMFLRASGPPRFTSGPHLRASFQPQGLTCPKTRNNFRPRASEVSWRPWGKLSKPVGGY